MLSALRIVATPTSSCTRQENTHEPLRDSQQMRAARVEGLGEQVEKHAICTATLCVNESRKCQRSDRESEKQRKSMNREWLV
jgi:hypothetical protein